MICLGGYRDLELGILVAEMEMYFSVLSAHFEGTYSNCLL